MSNLQHIAVEMDKLPSNKTPANNQGNHNEALGEIDGRKLRTPRAGSNAGVDDGLLGNGGGNVGMDVPRPNGGRRPSYAFPGYNGPEFVNINGVETPIPDVNAYQHKKTLAQGMMDLALLSANANQLRYVLETGSGHPYYYPSLIFISLSILFQIAVGIGLIWNGRFNIKNEQEICRANKINNYTVIGIFIVTVVNVLISAFGVADRSSVTTT
ncbi:ninjurin-A isoform X2 [Drosophila grimshawi]|uniref:ninjurin-A isoform X2 n=1 Tax=Drosophila grimshawi TaxID=7222 RepID=UPI000C86F191|nr:ninjurin-A isoform X2 [Drosophila grimshawi]